MNFKDSRLQEATLQELQLEMISRVQFNNCDGEHIVADLLDNIELWESVMMDAGCGSMVHLRDLPLNQWNVDTLFIVAVDGVSAEKLARMAENWNPDSIDLLYESATDDLLGGTDEEQRVVVIWWD
jgi:hypothetical protein